MSTVLYIGGVSPDTTVEMLVNAFAPYVLAASVVRHPATSQCVGQAYVTVPVDCVERALKVSEIGDNNVAVFPVCVEAWVAAAPPQLGPNVAVGALPAPPPASPGGAGGGGYDSRGIPTSQHASLQQVLDQLRQQLDADRRLTYNGKPYYMLLHEAAQKRQMTLQVSDGSETQGFSCTINVCHRGNVVCSGRGAGSSKKDAKHNAAAHCLDTMLASNQVSAMELIGYMTCANTSLGASFGAAAGASGSAASSVPLVGAQASSINLTQSVLELGTYPRCTEVMAIVHSTDTGRLKTLLSVLNEYATRVRLTVQQDELPTQLGTPPAVPVFRHQTRLLDAQGNLVAHAVGPEMRNKQESKQASAAATIEQLVAQGVATVEEIARTK